MMSPGGRPPDWSAILDRAHRRVVKRLWAAGAVGTIGAVILLGGGLLARGAIHDDGPTGQSKQPGQDSEAKGDNGGGENETGRPNLAVSIAGTDVVVTNDSRYPSGPFEVVIRVMSEGKPGETTREPYNGLEGMTSFTPLSFPCTEGTVKVSVNLQGDVAETSDDDNSASVKCPVGEAQEPEQEPSETLPGPGPESSEEFGTTTGG